MLAAVAAVLLHLAGLEVLVGVGPEVAPSQGLGQRVLLTPEVAEEEVETLLQALAAPALLS
jgi:hypothetical protein